MDHTEAERLVLLAKQGDSVAEEQALTMLRGICWEEAARYYRGDRDGELLFAEALYWAWRSIHIWDPAKGGTLAGTVRQIVRRKVQQDVKTSRRLCRHTDLRPFELDASPPWLEDETLGQFGAPWLASIPSAEDVYLEQSTLAEGQSAVDSLTSEMTPIERKVFEARMASVNPTSDKVMALDEYKRRGLTWKQADNALIRIRRRVLMWAQGSDSEVAAGLQTWLKSERGRWVLRSLRKWAQDKNLKFDAG